ncbi:transcriptional regulator of AraC family [alpha proteobacterium U9-1i]|nr:transcriptional regulator of AraC family [alpha proteobacterium U9-1i]
MLDPLPPRDRYGLGAAPDSFRVSELRCTPHGAGDGVYGEAGIALVLDGAFEYRGAHGAALALPGAVIFANRGESFSCTDAGAASNKRLALFFGSELLDEIADAHGRDRAEFALSALPPSRPASAFAPLLRAAARGDVLAAFDVASAAFATTSGPTRSVSTADTRRVLNAVRHVQANFAGCCALDTLASVAGLSRFHFARLFKTVTGESPAQYVLHTRLAAAARMLVETSAPVAQIAYGSGFSDLSHFNASFKVAFGATPSRWRAAA